MWNSSFNCLDEFYASLLQSTQQEFVDNNFIIIFVDSYLQRISYVILGKNNSYSKIRILVNDKFFDQESQSF